MNKNFFQPQIDLEFQKYNYKYLVISESHIIDGTSYCNFHFRKALLGEKNDFTGKTKSEIVNIMLNKTGRSNFNHIYNLIKKFKESKIPVNISVGERNPFSIIWDTV